MKKYAVRLEGKKLSRKDFFRDIWLRDKNFELDPEGNRITVWVTTCLSISDLMGFDGVEDVIEAMENKKYR